MTQPTPPQPELEKWSVALEERVSRELGARPIPFDGSGKKPVWSIDTPPPYQIGRAHV